MKRRNFHLPCEILVKYETEDFEFVSTFVSFSQYLEMWKKKLVIGKKLKVNNESARTEASHSFQNFEPTKQG